MNLKNNIPFMKLIRAAFYVNSFAHHHTANVYECIQRFRDDNLEVV